MVKNKLLVSFVALSALAGCTVPRPPSYAYYDRGAFDDPYYYKIPYAEPYLYKPYWAGVYYSGSPTRSYDMGLYRGYTGTYRDGWYR